ncbi:hypothetical protein HXX76_000855 [Chlamydomonas incerta]|uniref:Uncharacterized protein n=1 Tax=Chlamydomonas incerta TaxID=51695 RepID=A0A835WFR4_CHLIN|nr:hypothetical protein HXX76_000855 [Chlamydomonas incerta]|eukprot:KAG2446265.1 hypothetical protein HXX76_000855 [Chlamydomonas incerta]
MNSEAVPTEAAAPAGCCFHDLPPDVRVVAASFAGLAGTTALSQCGRDCRHLLHTVLASPALLARALRVDSVAGGQRTSAASSLILARLAARTGAALRRAGATADTIAAVTARLVELSVAEADSDAALAALGAAVRRRHVDASAACIAEQQQGSAAWMALVGQAVQPLLGAAAQGCEATAIGFLLQREDPLALEQCRRRFGVRFIDEQRIQQHLQAQERREQQEPRACWEQWDGDRVAGATTYLAGRIAELKPPEPPNAAAAAEAASSESPGVWIGGRVLLAACCSKPPAVVALALAAHARFMATIHAHWDATVCHALGEACEMGNEEVALAAVAHGPYELEVLDWLGACCRPGQPRRDSRHAVEWTDARVGSLAGRLADGAVRRALGAAGGGSSSSSSNDGAMVAPAAEGQPPPTPTPHLQQPTPQQPMQGTHLADALLMACTRRGPIALVMLRALDARDAFMAGAVAQLAAGGGGGSGGAKGGASGGAGVGGLGDRLGEMLRQAYCSANHKEVGWQLVQLLLARQGFLAAAVAHAPGQMGAVLRNVCGRGRMQLVAALLARRDLMQQLMETQTSELGAALVDACRAGHTEVVAALLGHDGLVAALAARAPAHAGGALEAACERGHASAVAALLLGHHPSNASNPSLLDAVAAHQPEHLGAALARACRGGHPGVVAALLAHERYMAAALAHARAAAAEAEGGQIRRFYRGSNLVWVVASAAECGQRSVLEALLAHRPLMEFVAAHAAGSFAAALELAVRHGHGDCVPLLMADSGFARALVQAAAGDPEGRAATALREACSQAHRLGNRVAVQAMLTHAPLMAALAAQAPEQLGACLVGACEGSPRGVLRLLLANAGFMAAVTGGGDGRVVPQLVEAVRRAHAGRRPEILAALRRARAFVDAVKGRLPAELEAALLG